MKGQRTREGKVGEGEDVRRVKKGVYWRFWLHEKGRKRSEGRGE